MDFATSLLSNIREYILLSATPPSSNPDSISRAIQVLLQQSNDVRGIFLASEAATFGAATFEARRAISEGIAVVGISESSNLINLVYQGNFSALVTTDSYALGYHAIISVVALSAGEKIPNSVNVPPKLILPTREFVEQHDYPPLNTAAYGIVAFPQGGTPGQKERMVSICQSYYETFLTPQQVSTPISEQMVTVWPVDSSRNLLAISRKSKSQEACDLAVEHYGLKTSLTAISEAELTTKGFNLNGMGPFLLASAPSTQKGKKDTLVLVVDLSQSTNEEQYLDYFRKWRDDIVKNPALWNNGWSLEKVRLAIRSWPIKPGQLCSPMGQ